MRNSVSTSGVRRRPRKAVGAILLAVCCLQTIGCTHVTSRHLCFGEEPFASTVAEPAVLRRPVAVRRSAVAAGEDAARVLFAAPDDRVPDVLPQGTEIRFDTFILCKRYACMVFTTHIEYTAWFYVPDLRLSEDLRFEYVWGRGYHLHRAPWEDASVPARRYVGAYGTGYAGDAER